MDFSSRLGNIVISGYEEKMVTYKFPNCIRYYNDEIRNRFNSIFFCDNIENNFSGGIVYPVTKGVFNDYDLLELLIGYANIDYINFNFIEECGIIFTEPINTDNYDREKIAEILFYTFNINKLFMIKPSVMTLLREGKTTGVVAQLDEDISNYVPIFDGFQLEHASIKSDFCRKNILEYLEYLLTEEYYFINNYKKSEI